MNTIAKDTKTLASYSIGYVSNTIRSNFDRIVIEIESKSGRIVKNTYSGKVIRAHFERVGTRQTLRGKGATRS
jgi:hypothetical protein